MEPAREDTEWFPAIASWTRKRQDDFAECIDATAFSVALADVSEKCAFLLKVLYFVCRVPSPKIWQENCRNCKTALASGRRGLLSAYRQ
jgi:hypothetical protein